MSSEGGNIPFSNRLWRARKRSGLGQKQVAFLIEKSVDEVSRYERGLHLPELHTLLALEVVYGIPLRLLYRELFDQVRDQITERINSREVLRSKYQDLIKSSDPSQEYCGYKEILKLPDLSAAERDKVRSHVTRVMRQVSDLTPSV